MHYELFGIHRKKESTELNYYGVWSGKKIEKRLLKIPVFVLQVIQLNILCEDTKQELQNAYRFLTEM